MIPLGLLSPGEQGEIAHIRSADHHGARGPGHVCCGGCRTKEKGGARIEDLGLRIGKKVEMLTNGHGPVLLRVDESRIALDRGLAMKIMVWR